MNSAFCSVSIAPIRREAADSSEMVSQLLFGEQVEIVDKKENWLFIQCHYDQYQGWIDEKQVHYTESKLDTPHLSSHLSHGVQFGDEHFNIVLGSRLPNFDGINFKIDKKKYIYNGNAINVEENPISNIKKVAQKYLHAPYLWGGRSPFGIDCSGFSQMVFSFFNIKLPRDAYQQAQIGETINFIAEAKVGDLIYFGDEEKIKHVGIYYDNQIIIHASGKVRLDTIDHVGIYNKEMKKYTHFLKTIKRIWT